MNSTSQKNIEYLYTNSIIYKGDDIRSSILPELVSRVSLSPIIEKDQVVENQFFTLHNDAGECVYISPALNEYMTKRRRFIPKPHPIPRPRRKSGWYFLPIALPAHPGGGGRGNRRRGWSIGDISFWYDGSNETTVPAQNKRGWKNSDIVRAVSAWENSKIETYQISLTNCEECTAMFKDCKNLRKFYVSNFKSCKNAVCMFENCTSLHELKCNKSTFYKRKGNKISGLIYGAKMFKGSGLQEIELDLLALKQGQEMFRDCTKLGRVDMKMLRLQNMDRMFQGCTKLMEVRFPHIKPQLQKVKCHLPNVTTAIGAFYNCRELANFGATRLNSLVDGSHMFQKCIKLAQIETEFPVLENAEQMYEGCTSLTQFATNTNTIYPELKVGRRMFMGCSEMTFTDLSNESFPKLEDGLSMFQDCTKLTTIPCNFPSLKCARQMFWGSGISGHLDVDMPTQFPNVSTNSYSGGNNPAAYMFGSCPITSVGFDVSSLDNGQSMFVTCSSLTTCTKAVFQSGGHYDNMFDEARFDRASADIIIQAAIRDRIAKIHIGVDSTYKTDEFKNTYGFSNLIDDDGNESDSQWVLNMTDGDVEVGTVVIRWN